MAIFGWLLVLALIYWVVVTGVVVIAGVSVLVAVVVGFLTYFLLGAIGVEDEPRQWISSIFGVGVSAIWIFNTYGKWGLIVAVVCVIVVLAKLND